MDISILNAKHSIDRPHLKTKNYQQKSKNRISSSMNNKTKKEIDDFVYIDLDMKCSCPHSSSSSSSIQFSRRYLHCPSSMPILILRSFIQQILPHSHHTLIFFYDINDRLLNDSDPLHTLHLPSSSLGHIPIRFTLINSITSLPHCSCLSSSSSSSSTSWHRSSSPVRIDEKTIEQTLSTCRFPPRSTVEMEYSIVNLLSPPPSSSSLIDEITNEFGEICGPSRKKRRKGWKSEREEQCRLTMCAPLDLTMKKEFSFSSNPLRPSMGKWIKT